MIKKISNVSTTLIVNTYESFYYGDNQDISDCEINISKKYNSENLLKVSRNISKTIQTEILHESSHNFKPFGDSGSLLIQADLNLYNSATLHLKESHITFHTYIEDILDNFAIVRLEYHISSCSDANVYNSLNDIILISEECFFPDLVTIDYIRRGAKYGNNPDDIIYDTNNPNFNEYPMYHISSITPSMNTSHHTLLLDNEFMLNKFQQNNSFFQSDMISVLKKFLIASYSNHKIDFKSSNLKSS